MMSTRYSLGSFTNTIISTLGNFWNTAKSYLTIEPMPLWQKAMEDPGYHAYRQFKSDLAYQPEIAVPTVVSPYAVIANANSTPQIKTAIEKLLRSDPERTLRYFYDDVMNQLVELSHDNSNVEDFTSMLAFYKPYVPEEIYQTALMHCEIIDKTNANFQTKIIDATKKINKTFKLFQIDMNSKIEAEQAAENAAPENHEPYHRPNFNQLIMMGAISLLANKNHLGLGLGLATTALFAEPVDAALPTVANPIPTQYAQPGKPFSYDIDLNHVFNDADGDIMTFGGVTMADGSPLPSWLTAKPIKLSGRDYANEGQAVEVVGDLAYVANGQYGLLIFNISTPNQKVFVSSFDTPGIALGITVQASIAYVADYGSGLQLINVSNPAAPSLLGSYDTPGYAQDVVVQAGIAYVADYTSGLQLINVSNASAPRLLGNHTTPGHARSVVVQAGIAYVADYGSGLQLINVSNPAVPSLSGSYATPGNVWGVTVQTGVAYVADDAYGLQLINVSNASMPSLLGSYDTPGYAYGVVVQAGIAYVADYFSGLQLINVSNASAPRLLGSYDTPGTAYGVVVQASVAYVADTTSGLQIIGLGYTQLVAIIPFHAAGNYSLKIHATNVNGEWISTDMELRIGARPSVAPASSLSAQTNSPPNSIANVASLSSVTSNPSSPATNASAPQSSNPRRFTVTASSNPIVIEGGSATLSSVYLTITGNVDPNQVVYTVQGNNPDIIITVNGVEATQFTQGDVESQFVSISLQGTGCQDYDNNLQLQASVAGSSTTVDFSLSVQVNTLSCNAGSRLVDTAVMNVATLLTATGLGFLTKCREKKESAQCAEPSSCATQMRLKH